MGSFLGFEIAKTGLFISQRSLNVIGHNIANANTVGYTRQRLSLESIEPATMNARYAPSAKGAVGRGVAVQVLDQIRNVYLDQEYRRENAVLGEWETRTEEMEYIESLFNETTDESISRTLADFFDSLNQFSMDTVSKEMRANVQQNAIKLTETFNHYYSQLSEMQKSMNESMKVTADRINDITATIADYNRQIYVYELGGEKANDLRDKRNLLLDELSGLVNMSYADDSNGYLIVTVEGVELVNHTTATSLDVVADQTGVVTGQTGFYSIYYEGTTTPFAYSGGELEGYRRLRDGNAADDLGIPRFIDNLNTLARNLAREFNTLHSAGYTMPHDGILSQTGIDFFDVPSGNYDLVTAETFALSAEVLDDVYNIAASDTLIDLSEGNPQQGNNVVALQFVALASRNDIPEVTNFEDYLKSIVLEVAIESAHDQKIYDSQQVIVDNLDNRRQSVSGVSIDEEMVEMVKYQHAYSAAARMITTIDEALDVLINKTGMVGR